VKDTPGSHGAAKDGATAPGEHQQIQSSILSLILKGAVYNELHSFRWGFGSLLISKTILSFRRVPRNWLWQI
jgi:hypothetical protein